MNKEKLPIDYIDNLEITNKILMVFAVLFWLLCMPSNDFGIIWGIGILLPGFAIGINKYKTMCYYFAFTVVYAIVANIISYHFLFFIPQIACCLCIFGSNLLSSSIIETEKIEEQLKHEKILYKEMTESREVLKQKISVYKLNIRSMSRDLHELSELIEENCETHNDEELIKELKERVSNLKFLCTFD